MSVMRAASARESEITDRLESIANEARAFLKEKSRVRSIRRFMYSSSKNEVSE